jgi:hypothetical protein
MANRMFTAMISATIKQLLYSISVVSLLSVSAASSAAAVAVTPVDAVILEAPTPTYPAAYITNRSPQFEWTAVADATSYEFMLTDETDLAVYFDQAEITTNGFSIAGAVFDQSKVYHWKVRAFASNSSPGAWSDIESFLIFDPAIVPNLLAPTGYITTTTPLFQWSAVPGAVSYELTILSEDETSIINTIGGIDSNSYQEPATIPLVPYTVYHYKVRSRMSDGTFSLASNPGSFMMYSGSDIPQLIGPAIQAPLGLTNFSWKPLEVAVGYELLLTSEDESTVLLDAQDIKVNGYMPGADVPLKIGVVYHWKVRTLMANGTTNKTHSLWSDTFSFVYFDPSIVPDPLLPFGYITSTKPILEWSQVDGAASYSIEIRDSLSQSLLLSESVANLTTYDLAKHLQLKKDLAYDWRVKSIMADGRNSVFSAARSFKITSAPWDGLITKQKIVATYYPSQSIQFSWLPLSLAGLGYVRYHLVLRLQPDDGNFRTLWSGDASPADPSHLILPEDVLLAPRTHYAWIVQAYNIDNILIGESRKVTFKTPAPAPVAEYEARIEAYKAQLAETFNSLVTSQNARAQALLDTQSRTLAKIQLELANKIAQNSKEIDALKVSLAAQLASLQKSQAIQMAELVKKKTTTPDQIAALQAKQSIAAQELVAKQAQSLSDTSARYSTQEKEIQTKLQTLKAQFSQQRETQLAKQALRRERLQKQQQAQLANFIRHLGAEQLLKP